MSEHSTALQFIKQQIAADAAGGAHPGTAPPGVATPFITITPYGGDDSNAVAATRIFSRLLYLIEAWGPDSDYASVTAAAKALDEHLHRQKNVTLTDGSVASSYRTQARLNFQEVDGVQWVREGGIYMIVVRSTFV